MRAIVNDTSHSPDAVKKPRLRILIPLVIGGLIAAPLGGWSVKHIPARALMIAVGFLVVAISAWQFARMLKLA